MNRWTFEQNYKNEQLMFMPVLSFTGINIYRVGLGAFPKKGHYQSWLQAK